MWDWEKPTASTRSECCVDIFSYPIPLPLRKRHPEDLLGCSRALDDASRLGEYSIALLKGFDVLPYLLDALVGVDG